MNRAIVTLSTLAAGVLAVGSGLLLTTNSAESPDATAPPPAASALLAQTDKYDDHGVPTFSRDDGYLHVEPVDYIAVQSSQRADAGPATTTIHPYRSFTPYAQEPRRVSIEHDEPMGLFYVATAAKVPADPHRRVGKMFYFQEEEPTLAELLVTLEGLIDDYNAAAFDETAARDRAAALVPLLTQAVAMRQVRAQAWTDFETTVLAILAAEGIDAPAPPADPTP